jgi:hypothetical protein
LFGVRILRPQRLEKRGKTEKAIVVTLGDGRLLAVNTCNKETWLFCTALVPTVITSRSEVPTGDVKGEEGAAVTDTCVQPRRPFPKVGNGKGVCDFRILRHILTRISIS